MPLILAIEPDVQQADLLSGLAPQHVNAEILLAASVESALRVLETRVPDLLLTPLLLSAREDAALTARVRELDDRGITVPVLVIPVLAVDEPVTMPPERPRGLLTRIRKPKVVAPARAKGCRPEVFAEQIAAYLARAAAERHDREETERASPWSTPGASATAPLLAEWLTIHPEGHADDRATAIADEWPLPEAQEIAVPPPVLSPDAEAASVPEAAVDMLVSAVVDDIRVDDVSLAEQQDVPLPGQQGVGADELWTPLPASCHQLMAPIEGPALPAAAGTRKPMRPRKAERSTKRSQQPSTSRGAKRPRAAVKPMQDEWGLYDPEQCGFAALLERLEELGKNTGKDEARERRSAIMRR